MAFPFEVLLVLCKVDFSHLTRKYREPAASVNSERNEVQFEVHNSHWLGLDPRYEPFQMRPFEKKKISPSHSQTVLSVSNKTGVFFTELFFTWRLEACLLIITQEARFDSITEQELLHFVHFFTEVHITTPTSLTYLHVHTRFLFTEIKNKDLTTISSNCQGLWCCAEHDLGDSKSGIIRVWAVIANFLEWRPYFLFCLPCFRIITFVFSNKVFGCLKGVDEPHFKLGNIPEVDRSIFMSTIEDIVLTRGQTSAMLKPSHNSSVVHSLSV